MSRRDTARLVDKRARRPSWNETHVRARISGDTGGTRVTRIIRDSDRRARYANERIDANVPSPLQPLAIAALDLCRFHVPARVPARIGVRKHV